MLTNTLILFITSHTLTLTITLSFDLGKAIGKIMLNA